jgi:hypothetical protein
LWLLLKAPPLWSQLEVLALESRNLALASDLGVAGSAGEGPESDLARALSAAKEAWAHASADVGEKRNALAALTEQHMLLNQVGSHHTHLGVCQLNKHYRDIISRVLQP